MTQYDLILASASPRRLELLRSLGLSPRVLPAHLAEQPIPGEPAIDLALRLAREKGRAVARSVGRPRPPAVVLAADTIVVIDGRALGKPRDAEEARSMLGALSGRTHQVITAVYLARTDDPRESNDVDTTCVTFGAHDAETIARYVDTGEPMDKAGGYGIQGQGGALAERIEGSWSNVVGLPLERLPGWLRGLGLSFENFRRP